MSVEPTEAEIEAAELAMQFWQAPDDRTPDDAKPTWHDLATAALAAAAPLLEERIRADERAKIAAETETVIEYGHPMPEPIGWLIEPRGIKYARAQRTVHVRAEEPILLDHWSDPTGKRKPFDPPIAARGVS